MVYGYLCTRDKASRLLDLGLVWRARGNTKVHIGFGADKLVYVVTLPFRNVHLSGRDAVAAEKAAQKAVIQLKEMGAAAITGCRPLRECGILERCAARAGIAYPDGRRLMRALLPQALRRVAKELGIKPGTGTLAIAMEAPEETEEILNGISGIFRFAVIAGGQPFLKAAEDICAQSGLAARVCGAASGDVAVYGCGRPEMARGKVVFDLCGNYPRSKNVVKNAFVELQSSVTLPVPDEPLDLCLAEWHLMVMYGGADIGESAVKADCKLTSLVYSEGMAAAN